MFGPGTYAVVVQNPGETAGVMMVALSLRNGALHDSVELASRIITGLRGTLSSLEVDRIRSSQDWTRTIALVRYEDDGVPGRGHFYFFLSSRAAVFLGFGAREQDFEKLRPLLVNMISNIAYAPGGLRPVMQRARARADEAAKMVVSGRGATSPIELIQLARRQGRPSLALRRVTAASS